MEYQFEWDTSKAIANVRKHKVTFERAATVFLDPNSLSVFDMEHGEGEERWITLGLDRSGVFLVVCHTFRGETEESATVRIISARKATKHEVKAYKAA